MEPVPGSSADPVSRLRAFRDLAPWNLKELSATATRILEAAGVSPINTAASSRPSERTIRFYVTRGLVAAPEGRGTAAIYHYRHLLQVLIIKLRQMEGATLTRLADELAGMTGDVIERRVAASLGEAIPSPGSLTQPAPVVERNDGNLPGTGLRRIVLMPGAELLLDDRHSALFDPAIASVLAARAAQVIERLTDSDTAVTPPAS